MTTLIIAILMAWGIISSPADLDDLTPEQQEQIEIIIPDEINAG